MSRAPLLALAVSAVAAVGAAAALQIAQEEPFPHDAHEGLFPVCTGCHGGIPDGQRAGFYPQEESCANCHDGVQEDQVEWTTPSPAPTTLAFTHEGHAAEVAGEGEPPLSCARCHVTPGETRMAMDGNPAERCITCHTEPEPSPDHLVGAECTTCHVPLAESGLPRDRLHSLDEPPAHEGDDFLFEIHGAEAEADAARCATCHVRDQCTSCHVDSGVEAIRSVPRAPAALMFEAIAASYPTPASHRVDGFAIDHGEGAGAACASCHTRNDCVACHEGAPPASVPRMPDREDVDAPGVQIARAEPGSHESTFFMEAHSILAAAGDGGCAGCHTEDTCVACHDGADSNSFHPSGFMVRHSADAYGQTAECASCHNTQVFCRSCHLESGFESSGRLGPGFHDAEPVWLLRHGQAARQTLEACASCHAQRDCTQCHSVLGAFQVNPHGPDFDARRARDRNARVCLACHVRLPGGVP